MGTDKEPKAERKKKSKTRLLKWVLAGAIALILLAVFAVPVFVSSEKGRKIILAKINESVAGKTDFGSLSMSWWKGVKVTDLSFNDDAGGTWVSVKQIATKPHYGSLLLGSLSLGRTVVDEPRVEINLAKVAPPKAEGPGQEVRDEKKTQAVGLPVKRVALVVNNGNLKVTDAEAETVELSQINSKLNLRPPGKQTNFEVDMTVVDGAEGAKVRADGRIKPSKRDGWSLKGTSGYLSVEVNDLELESLGPIFALGGIEIEAEGRIWGKMEGEVKDGRIEDLNGTIKGEDLAVTGEQLKGDRLKTSVLDVDVKLHREKEVINIEKVKVHSDWVAGEVSGVVPTTFESLAEFVKPDSVYSLKGSFECDLGEALSQMPRTFGVREGMRVTSGQLTGRVETTSKAGEKKIYASGNLAGLAGVVGTKTIALSEPVIAEAEITSDKAGIKFDKLDVSASFAKINCKGTDKLLEYEAEANLEKLQSELGQFINIGQYRMAGEVFSKGQVSGTRDKISAVGSSLVKDFRLSSKEGLSAFEPKAEIDFSVAFEPKESVVDVNFIKANASLGEVSIRDTVLGLSEKAEGAMKVAVSANNVDLEKLGPFAVVVGSFPKEMQLAGTVKTEFSVSSEKDSYRIVTDGTHIENLKVSYAEKTPFEQKEVSLVADVEVNRAEKSFAVKRFELVSEQIKIHKGEIIQVSKAGKSKLKGEVDCEYDWAAVSSLAASYWPAGLEVEGKRKDVISFSSEYPAGQTDKLLSNLSTKGKLGFERAYYKGLAFSPTEVEIRIEKGLFVISEFSSKVNNGVFRFAGKADLKQKPMIFETLGPIKIAEGVQLNDDMSRELLVYVNPVFANAFDVSGVGNFNCERLAIPLAAGEEKKIQIMGTIWADNLRLSASDLLSQLLSVGGLRLRDQTIKVHPTRFMLWDGFVRYDDMQVDVGDNPINFKGIIGLDKSLNMTVTLPYTLDGRTVRVGEEAVGARMSLPLKGTVDKPELDVGKLLEGQLKQRLEDELRKGLEGLFK